MEYTYQTPAETLHFLESQRVSFSTEFNIGRAHQLLENTVNKDKFLLYARFLIKHRTEQLLLFKDIVDLYLFDKALSLLCLERILMIEERLKGLIDNALSSQFTPYWYVDRKIYYSESQKNGTESFYIQFLQKLQANYKKSQHSYESYRKVPFSQAANSISFGTLLKIIQYINPTSKKDNKLTNALKNVTQGIHLKDFKDMEGCLTVVRDIRNKAAHNSRLWNVQYPKPKDFQGRYLKYMASKPYRIYSGLCMIHLMSKGSELPYKRLFFSELEHLMHTSLQQHWHTVLLEHMGFPSPNQDWRNDPIWQD